MLVMDMIKKEEEDAHVHRRGELLDAQLLRRLHAADGSLAYASITPFHNRVRKDDVEVRPASGNKVIGLMLYYAITHKRFLCSDVVCALAGADACAP